MSEQYLKAVKHVTAAYLCLEFSGGTEFKKELHDVMVPLLGGEEQSRRTCLERMIKKDTPVYL